MLFEKYSELSKDIFRDIQCMSMNISTSIATELQGMIDTTVSNYLANSLPEETILNMDPSKLANPHMAGFIQIGADQLRRRKIEGKRREKRRERRRAKRDRQPPASSTSEKNPSSLSSEDMSMSIRTKATSTSTGA
jgi:hypothetical protein